jgi:UDP-glucose 4-epimerase
MRSVIVTGANGLLGRAVCRLLIAENALVTAIVRSHSSAQPEGVTQITLDLSSQLDIERLPKRVDYIIHLAQSPRFRHFPDGALDVFGVNISSTAQLLDYARSVGVKGFVYASSGGVYGNGLNAFTENSNVVPAGQLGYYLGSKACGEILVQSYSALFRITVIRPFFIYGRGQNRDMLIPRLFDSVSSGRQISLQGENGIYINPIHVEDAGAAVVAALDTNESKTYNLAGPDVLSIRQICDALGNYLGCDPNYHVTGVEPRNLVADISAMKSILHSPTRHLIDSLDEISSPTY